MRRWQNPNAPAKPLAQYHQRLYWHKQANHEVDLCQLSLRGFSHCGLKWGHWYLAINILSLLSLANYSTAS